MDNLLFSKLAMYPGGVMMQGTPAPAYIVPTGTTQTPSSVKPSKSQASSNKGLTSPAIPKENAAASKPTGFLSLIEQMDAVMKAESTGVIDPRLKSIATGGNGTINSDGGFFLQPEFSQTLLESLYGSTELLDRVKKESLTGRTDKLKLFGIDDTDRTANSRLGGVKAAWLAEADQIDASKPQFREVNIGLGKLAGLMYATSELSVDGDRLFLQAIRSAFSEEFSFLLEDGILNGTGAGKPLGILNSSALITVEKESGQEAGTVIQENINKMWQRLPARCRKNAIWMMNTEHETSLGDGGVLGDRGLIQYPDSESPYGYIKGRPVIVMEQCKAPGIVGDIVLIDPTQYLILDRGGLQELISIHVRFIQHEEAFRFILQVDGTPLWHMPVTPLNGSLKQSPYITLAERS